MMKLTVAAAISLAAFAAPAFAGGNSETARGLAATVSGTPGVAGDVAPGVSGQNADKGASGWGNASGVSGK